MKIKEKRIAAGLTQVQLAGRMGVAQSTVCSWETGAALPGTGLLPKLADILGCTIDALFGRESEVSA